MPGLPNFEVVLCSVVKVDENRVTRGEFLVTQERRFVRGGGGSPMAVELAILAEDEAQHRSSAGTSCGSRCRVALA